jgi:hypothetical protein
MGRFDLKKLNEVQVGEEYRIKCQTCAVSEDLDHRWPDVWTVTGGQTFGLSQVARRLDSAIYSKDIKSFAIYRST